MEDNEKNFGQIQNAVLSLQELKPKSLSEENETVKTIVLCFCEILINDFLKKDPWSKFE